MPKKKNIVLAVSGSIAAYKAADIVSGLVKEGAEVHVVMTPSACEFIQPLTLQVLSKNPVTTDLFDEKDSWRPGHIELADNADLFLLAPATANQLAKLANGIADDAIGAIALATRAQLLAAPAMNGKMWEHPATTKNVATLKDYGWDFIGPAEGMLACGYEGTGRLWKTDEIIERALSVIQ